MQGNFLGARTKFPITFKPLDLVYICVYIYIEE